MTNNAYELYKRLICCSSNPTGITKQEDQLYTVKKQPTLDNITRNLYLALQMDRAHIWLQSYIRDHLQSFMLPSPSQ